MTQQLKNDITDILVSETKTSTTTFLLPALKLNKALLDLYGFKNAYYADDGHDVIYENSLTLVFKPGEKIDEFDNIIKHIEEGNKINEVYDLKEFTIISIKFPSEFNSEYIEFKNGKFSRFSSSYINSFFPFKKAVKWDSKGKVSKEEYTLFYHIFNRTDWLKEWWAKRLGYDDMKEFELEEWWNKPHDKEEVFRYKNK